MIDLSTKYCLTTSTIKKGIKRMLNDEKISFNIPLEEINALREYAKERHITIKLALRRAIKTLLLVDNERRKGAKILIEDIDRTISILL